MSMKHATIYGICLGLLSGIIVALLFNLNLADAAYRTLILSVSGGWMGMLLALLQSILQPPEHNPSEHSGKTQP